MASFIAIIALCITIWNPFFRKRLEIKLDCYQRVMKTLYVLKETKEFFYDDRLTMENADFSFDEDEIERYEKTAKSERILNQQRFKQAKLDLIESTRIYGLFLGKESEKIVSKLIDGLDENERSVREEGKDDDTSILEDIKLLDICIKDFCNYALEHFFLKGVLKKLINLIEKKLSLLSRVR
jgi:hypothetical protein